MNKKIGFIFLDELHHIHHFLSPAVELSRIKGFEVDILTYENSHGYLKKLINLMGGEQVNIVMLSTYLYRRVIERINKREQPSALYIYEKHIKKFLKYDALVFTDHTAGKISKAKKKPFQPLLVLLGHGAGDRAYGYKETHNLFNLALVAGEKKFNRLGREFPNREFEVKIGGYSKFDVVEIEFKENNLFSNSNQTVLYCPHFDKALSSWQSDGQAIMNFFLTHPEFNLIFAPHYNLFNKKSSKKSLSAIKEFVDVPNIYIDLGSYNSTNMSYTLGCDIYLGDISSQAYEFMYKIRPMIFYNAHNINWQGDDNYMMWNVGKVVNSINELELALQAIEEWADGFEEKQKLLFANTFDINDEKPGLRIARLIQEELALKG